MAQPANIRPIAPAATPPPAPEVTADAATPPVPAPPSLDATAVGPVDADRIPVVNPEADFVILHHGVGLFARGDKVSESDFPVGVDIQRLLDLGAIGKIGS